MPARLAVPKIPRQPSVPPALPLYKNHSPLSRSESTLLQLLIPPDFISFISNAYKKPQGGAPSRDPKVLQLVTPDSLPIRPCQTGQATLATHHSSLATIPFRIRTSKTLARNSCRIRTSKTQDLKPFRMNTYEKKGVGGPLGFRYLLTSLRHSLIISSASATPTNLSAPP
jgi:hypothetical protein